MTRLVLTTEPFATNKVDVLSPEKGEVKVFTPQCVGKPKALGLTIDVSIVHVLMTQPVPFLHSCLQGQPHHLYRDDLVSQTHRMQVYICMCTQNVHSNAPNMSALCRMLCQKEEKDTTWSRTLAGLSQLHPLPLFWTFCLLICKNL